MTKTIEEAHCQFLTGLFAEFDSASIDYCIIRNFELLPQQIDDDIDILVAEAQIPHVESIIRKVVLPNFVIIRIVRRNYHFQIYITSLVAIQSAISERIPVRFIELDFVTSLQWRGIPYICAASALANRQRHGCFYILCKEHHISHLICHAILDKRQFSDKYWTVVLRYFAKSSGRAPDALLSFFGPANKRRFETAVHRLDSSAAARLRKGLIYRALIRPRNLFRGTLFAGRKYWRIFCAIARPPGLLITAVGPDGVGKTTLLNTIREVFREIFQPVTDVYMGWKDFILPTKRVLLWLKSGFSKLIGTREANQPASVTVLRAADNAPSWVHNFSVVHYFFDLYARYFVRIRPLLARGGLVLCDRYFYDIFWQKLYLTNTSAFQKVLVKICPRPSLTIVFSGDPEVIAARKLEVSAVETAEQMETFRKLLDLNEQTLELDASAPLNRNVLAVIERLLRSQDDGKDG